MQATTADRAAMDESVRYQFAHRKLWIERDLLSNRLANHFVSREQTVDVSDQPFKAARISLVPILFLDCLHAIRSAILNHAHGFALQ